MKKNLIIFVLIAIISIVIFLFFLNKNKENSNFTNIKKDFLLFYGQGCPHCANVDKFLNTNNLREKILIEEKEVYYNQENAKLLIDAAKKCGFDENEIGVPFLLDKKNNKCIMGDEPIISFFNEKFNNE